MNINQYFKDQSGIDLDFHPVSLKLTTGEFVCGYATSIDSDFLCVMSPMRLAASMDYTRTVTYYLVEYDILTADVFQMFNKKHIVTSNVLKIEYENLWRKTVLEKFKKIELDARNKDDLSFLFESDPSKIH